MLITNESCSEFEQHHYKSLHIYETNNTMRSEQWINQPIRLKKVHYFLFVWFLEYCNPSRSIYKAGIHILGDTQVERIWPFFGELVIVTGYQSCVKALCGFRQVIGICITFQCWSAEPDSKTTTKRTWNKKWKWRNEHRQIEEMGWECSSVCWNPSIYQICISNVWIVKKPV